jgi:ABC-type lipoprotein release transport system permease subunit
MAYRNVLRQKRRTLLTVLTMVGGFTLSSISIAWSDGAYDFVIDLFTRHQLGHIQIHGEGYLDRPTLYNTVDDYLEVGNELLAVEGVQSWAPRVYSAGLASVDERTTGARIVGLDRELENAATLFSEKIVEGRSFADSESMEAVLGSGLAEVLKAEPGGTLVIVSQGADGSIANDAYTVVGLAETDNLVNDRTAVYLTLAESQELLVLEGRVHEIAIVIDELDDVALTTAAIDSALHREGLAVEPWQVFAKSFYAAMKADQDGTWISLAVIMAIVAVGVLNTVLMTVLERTREYGVLRAIGVRPGQVTRLVIYEVVVMACIAIMLGLVTSLGCNYWLSVAGVSIGEFTYGGVEFTEMYAEMNVRSYVIPALIVMISAAIVGIFPAVKAARTQPAKAMRTH